MVVCYCGIASSIPAPVSKESTSLVCERTSRVDWLLTLFASLRSALDIWKALIVTLTPFKYPRSLSPLGTAESGSCPVALHMAPRTFIYFAFVKSITGYAFAEVMSRGFQGEEDLRYPINLVDKVLLIIFGHLLYDWYQFLVGEESCSGRGTVVYMYKHLDAFFQFRL